MLVGRLEYLATGMAITVADVRAQLPAIATVDAGPEELLQRLEANRWDVSRTARALGISRSGLYLKIKQYGLKRPRPART